MWSDDLGDRTSPISDAPAVLAASYVAGGFLRVYGFQVYNSKASAQYVQVFDSGSLPADTAVPRIVYNLPTKSTLAVYFGPMGRLFARGLVLCNSSTDTTKTIGSADCFFDAEYDALQPPASYSSE